MISEEKRASLQQDADEKRFADRLEAIAEGIRSWTEGKGAATVQLPGEPPRALTIDEMRAIKKARRS